ncbi:hypothetical protein [Streptomyces sp. NPDC002526]
MSDTVATLLASIDDVLEAASVPAPSAPVEVAPAAPVEVPVPAPAVPPVPAEAPVVPPAAPVPPAPVEAPVEAPEAPARRAPRLPDWWQKDRPEPDVEADVEAGVEADGGECEHGRAVPLLEERGSDVVARLCLDCDARLPADDPEPDPDCKHSERLEVRSRDGGRRLLGYVCADERCATRMTVREVHGRAGKWLRTHPGYYPHPLRTAEGERRTRPALSPGTRRLLAHGGAAGAGYLLGLTPMLGDWIEECGETTSISGALVLGGVLLLAVAHFWDRRTRHWHPVLAWVARIPLASVVTAIALYAPASQI